MRQRTLRIAGIVFLALCAVGQAGEGFVRRDGARLTLDGREYRAIGMNSPDLFASYAGIFFHPFLAAPVGHQLQVRRTVFVAERHLLPPIPTLSHLMR